MLRFKGGNSTGSQSFEKKAKASINNKQLESFFGQANLCERMIPFATKMFPINDIRNGNFSRGKVQRKAIENIINELCANPQIQTYSLQKEAFVTSDASEKVFGGVLSQEVHPVLYVLRKLISLEQT